jgi:hypothetical protein
MLKNDWITNHSVLELQVLTTTLLESFEFSLPQDEKARIYRKPGNLMIPMIDGHNGAWLGLNIKALD